MSVALAAAGASIFLLLGLAHAVFSLQSRPDSGPLMPTSPTVRAAMREVGGLGMAPDIESSLYRAWIGFNFSHSLGIIAIAGIVLANTLDDFAAATSQVWFLTLIVVAPILYFVLAVNYWFAKPRDGIVVATALLWLGTLIQVF